MRVVYGLEGDDQRVATAHAGRAIAMHRLQRHVALDQQFRWDFQGFLSGPGFHFQKVAASLLLDITREEQPRNRS